MNYCRNLYSYLICIVALILSSILSWSCSSPAVIKSFTASPSSINSGQASTLEWDVEGTNAVNITNGIGSVVPSGQAVVTPQVTTTYLLTVPDDTQSIAVTVEVNSTPEAGEPETPQATEPGSESNQPVNSPSITSTLKYDFLGSAKEDLSNQMAVWHTYAKLPQAAVTASAGYSANSLQAFTSSGSTGIPVKSPLIILPSRGSMDCIVKSYSGLSYQFFKIGSTWYGDTENESVHLNQPGWGLMTTFSPASAPFTIQGIDIAAAANNTGPAGDYDNYHFAVRILDENGKQIWSKLLPWSLFRGDTSEGNPQALWKGIEVDNVSVSGDFSVEVLTESNEFLAGKSPSYHYLALAYETIRSKDANTRSFISEEGKKADSYIGLYDDYGHPLVFNLCIRVDGNYPAR